METALIIYAVCTAAVLVWSTLGAGCGRPEGGKQFVEHRLEYVGISTCTIERWAQCCTNLVIFDLSATHTLPGSLHISLYDLRGMLKWLPPGSRVVVSCLTNRLDGECESALLLLGIEVIYLVECSAASAPSFAGQREVPVRHGPGF